MKQDEYKDCTNLGQILEGFFPAVYLAIIAMMQCLVISELAAVRPLSTVFKDLDLEVFKLLFAVLAAFTVWHHYVYGVLFGRWRPSLWDSLIPFGLGFLQFAMSANISEPKSFWGFSGALGICGAIAYFHSGRRVKAHFFAHRLLMEDAVDHCKRFRILSNCAAVSFLVLGIITLIVNVFLTMEGWPLAHILGTVGPSAWIVCHLIAYEFCIKRYISPRFENGLSAHYRANRSQLQEEGHELPT